MKYRNAKLVLIACLAVLTIILVAQNTQEVETRLLFASVTMPRAVLLVIALLVGFLVGLATASRWRSSSPVQRSDPPSTV